MPKKTIIFCKHSLFFLLLIFLSGCASNATDGLFDPVQTTPAPNKPVVRVVDNGQLRLTFLVLDQQQMQQELGVDLTLQGIRGIRIEIDNQSDGPYWFLRSSLDWDYYPVTEILYSLQGQLGQNKMQALKKKLLAERFRNPVPAHSKVSGFIFVSSHHLNRVAHLALLGLHGIWKIPVFLPVPELKGYHLPKQSDLYTPEEITHTDKKGLRNLLNDLPCCTTDAHGEKQGDPLNLVIVGNAFDLQYAFSARSWHSVEINYLDSAKKTIKSFLFGDQYRYSPVSPLYAFGRKQDYALQKARSNISQRNHLRLWLTPWVMDGQPVWVGQVSRDIGVRMTSKSPIFFTHKIDPDIDEDRNYLMEDLLLTEQVDKIGYIRAQRHSADEKSFSNLTGDTYYTDNLRAVIFLGSHKRPFFRPLKSNVEFLNWDHTRMDEKSRHIDFTP